MYFHIFSRIIIVYKYFLIKDEIGEINDWYDALSIIQKKWSRFSADEYIKNNLIQN